MWNEDYVIGIGIKCYVMKCCNTFIFYNNLIGWYYEIVEFLNYFFF